MISLDTVEAEIIDLEKRDTSYAVVERLAWLYVVRDHMLKESSEEALAVGGSSEFLQAVNGAPMDGVLQIFDEHMEIIASLYPREYASILSRITALK